MIGTFDTPTGLGSNLSAGLGLNIASEGRTSIDAIKHTNHVKGLGDCGVMQVLLPETQQQNCVLTRVGHMITPCAAVCITLFARPTQDPAQEAIKYAAYVPLCLQCPVLLPSTMDHCYGEASLE